MMPNEASKERKPKHDLESIADGMESEAVEPGMPDFMKDAEALLALEAKRDKLIDQKTELSKAGNVLELKPGVASGAIDKEIDSLQDKVNGVLGKYGKEANAFQVDAYRVGELKDNVADAEAILRGLEADYKNEKNRDAKAKLERQIEDATAAWQEARNELSGMKDKYVAKEAAAKAELSGATEEEIEAALEPLDMSPKLEVRDATDEETEEVLAADEMERDTADAIKMTMDTLKEAIDEKEARQKAMAERVDARLKEEDDNERELQASLQELQELGKQHAKEKEEMSRETDEAVKMAIETSKEALAEEGKRDTIPDAGMAERMKEAAAEDEEIEVEEGELINDDVADSKAEDDFFAGKTEAGAVREGERNAERAEMAQEAEKLRGQMPEMQRQLSRAEKYLNDLGVKDVDGMMAQRAKDGFFGKAKGALGGLFSKKTRDLNRAIGLYESIRDQHNEMAEKLGKLEMQLNPTDKQKDMARIAAENRQGRR